MRKFIYWLIFKFWTKEQFLSDFFDLFGRKEKMEFIEKEYGFVYATSPLVQRAELFENIYNATEHDHYIKGVKYRLLITNILSKYFPADDARTLAFDIIQKAFTETLLLKGNFVKVNAALTNIVKTAVDEIDSTDKQVIVALLRKRVEE